MVSKKDMRRGDLSTMHYDHERLLPELTTRQSSPMPSQQMQRAIPISLVLSCQYYTCRNQSDMYMTGVFGSTLPMAAVSTPFILQSHDSTDNRPDLHQKQVRMKAYA